MTITPEGLPAWSRTADHSQYGGHVAKTNFQSQGVVNPRTDVGAEAIVRHASDTAAAVRTAEFAVITFLCNDGSPAVPTIESCQLMTGIASAPYAGDSPPTGFPSAARNGNGDVTFTFDTSYEDDYSIAEDFAPTQADTSASGATFAHATYVISGQTVRVRVWDAAGVALADRRVTLTVW